MDNSVKWKILECSYCFKTKDLYTTYENNVKTIFCTKCLIERYAIKCCECGLQFPIIFEANNNYWCEGCLKDHFKLEWKAHIKKRKSGEGIINYEKNN